MGPNHFGRVPFVLDVSNLFWSGPNYKNRSKKDYFEPDQNDLDPTKSIWTDQNDCNLNHFPPINCVLRRKQLCI